MTAPALTIRSLPTRVADEIRARVERRQDWPVCVPCANPKGIHRDSVMLVSPRFSPQDDASAHLCSACAKEAGPGH
jgi:hypothetical protein